MISGIAARTADELLQNIGFVFQRTELAGLKLYFSIRTFRVDKTEFLGEK